ncbi:MAG: hypothetical protein KKD63_05760 [Proteobacteria bacterium]|nr:hypothetical protein [Desulfobulbaceae bacterium]MBU4152366.1 hypothetical protein [Pseudomonadota bacterium]
MRIDNYIPLERQFSPVPKSQEDAESDEILSSWGHVKLKTWDDMDREFRCVILAEAGAGKTEELRQHARVLATLGKSSFFIRIEDIEADFYNAFEVGEEAHFQTWLQSTEDAWFFLDSVDESRLENPRAFEKALRRFAKGIKEGAHRAHIYLSSRPYAWHPSEDRRLLDEIMFLAAPQKEHDGDEDQQSEPQSALTIYSMRPLDKERIRRFCVASEAKDIDRLLHEIERANLWGLAERPFDLGSILAKWEGDNTLGGRLELLRHNIDKRLRDDHNSDRAQRQPLNLERAREGARRLAAAVILTGQVGLNVPDATPVKPGIEAESVLADWDPNDVCALLERGIFNDIIYGAVRFRNRDVRELLAAEWFDGLLKSGNSRYSVEALFFREQYGEEIITPRLRPILPWLILLDNEIRRRALKFHPEIAVEEGDPSRLPLLERQRILADIVRRIVSDEDNRSARDNCSIARIANLDLSEDTQQLIDKYFDNDDAIFFLGRLVWQGGMASCVSPFIDIAQDSSRGIYARRVSARAVMTCGSVEQKRNLWQRINESDDLLPRGLLAEIVEAAEPDSHNIEQLMISLGKLARHERYNSDGLDDAFHFFIERLPVSNGQVEISHLLDGLNSYLDRPPYVERKECHVSKEYAWLLGPATHAIERVVVARSTVALGGTALSIMLKVPAVRYWSDDDFREYKSDLHKYVPNWPELNDALYWASVDQARAATALKSGEPLTNDWSISWLGHYWAFDAASLSRLLNYIGCRQLKDDRLVALSTAYRVYVQADRLAHVLASLRGAVADDHVLRDQLEIFLNPPVPQMLRRQEEEHTEYLRKQDEKNKRKKQARDTWIEELRINPDRVRNPPNFTPGEWTNDQCWLLHEVLGRDLKTSRSEGANWQALIPDFGDAVARAYRDAAINHWRHFMPTLQSEGVKRDNTTLCSLIFAMAGLEIEAAETADFPRHLNESQVRHALRYITWELNGFPSWFECVHKAFPALVNEAVIQELLWELENTGSDQPMHYILHDLVYHAPWLHSSMAPVLLEWVEANPTRIEKNRHYCLHILANGGTDPARLAALARRQIEQTNDRESIPWWYALRVDCDPANGITEVEQWLSGLDEEVASRSAQIFVTALMGGSHVRNGGPSIGHFRTAEHLKSLYILMHRYIRVQEDINRANGGVYTPELRDDAQDARNRLFNLLSEIPGKASYTFIKQLIHEHPDPNYRPWMAKQAYKRAEEDGDLESWTAEQVNAFDRLQTITPATHRQLFDLAVQHLHDLKNWLERGNDSPWRTWQRSNGETEMRTLIAGWLNQQCHRQYTTAQEPELANSQRMDIWLHNTNVHSPVPIELKLLDKDWTGPDLCERLRNQLAGDYLREESAGCGVMLLVFQGRGPEKRWMVNGQLVGLSELAGALKIYWQSIAGQYPGVEAIDVIVIDLTQREQVSDS